MAAPEIILNAGQVLLSQSSSTGGIVLDNSPFLFGKVEIVNELSDNYIVNDIVMFDPTGSTKFKYSGVDYFLVFEDKIYFKEVPPT